MLHTVPISALVQNGLVVGKRRRTTYPLSYRTNEATLEPVVCQTPWLWLPMPPRYVTRQRRRVHFFHVVFQPEVVGAREWVKCLHQIHHALHQWLTRKAASNNDPSTLLQWVDTLETVQPLFNDSNGSNDTVPHETRWKISTQLHKTAQCYDATGAPMSFQTFGAQPFTPTHVRLLVQFTNVWVNASSGTCGLALNVLQLQHDTVQAPVHLAFTDVRRPCVSVGTQTDDVQCTPAAPVSTRATAHSTTRTAHPVYGKYFKMLQKGVPKPAVQHKMRMNGVDASVLDLPADAPLPCEPATHTSSDLLSASLQDTQHLRKTEINADRPKATPKSGAGHGFSLGEIVNGLQSLRKTLWGTRKDVRPVSDDQPEDVVPAQTTHNELFLQLLGKHVQGE